MLKTGYEESNDFSYDAILGIDECGYGCGAGDLFICGVVLPKDYSNSELKDSKLIKSEKKMERIANELRSNKNILYLIYKVSVNDINELGVSKALTNGVNHIIKAFTSKKYCDAVMVDGLNKGFVSSVPLISVIKGDNTYQNIAAASIICKNSRDNYMKELSKTYTGYDLENNKGYLTEKHIKGLNELGKTVIHRDKYVKKFV